MKSVGYGEGVSPCPSGVGSGEGAVKNCRMAQLFSTVTLATYFCNHAVKSKLTQIQIFNWYSNNPTLIQRWTAELRLVYMYKPEIELSFFSWIQKLAPQEFVLTSKAPSYWQRLRLLLANPTLCLAQSYAILRTSTSPRLAAGSSTDMIDNNV